ncbi:MAG: hypothetical protein JNM36_04790 [Chitinophagales bacterium]|jgi:hypothetical protein|nr:hypothetical protein [Chitinophagales bacterium]
MKNLVLTIALVFVTFTAFAQSTVNTVIPATVTPTTTVATDSVMVQTNTVFAEVGNNGSLYSLNFDHIVFATPAFALTTKVGVGATVPSKNDIDPTLSLEVNALFGKTNHRLETSIGTLVGFGFEQTEASLNGETAQGTKVVKYTPEKEYTTLNLTARVGYRYQNPNGGLFFRAGITPIATVYSKTGNFGMNLAGAVGLGYTFKQKRSVVPVINFN